RARVRDVETVDEVEHAHVRALALERRDDRRADSRPPAGDERGAERHDVVATGSCANCSRNAVLRNLPTAVFGISAMNSKRSGSHNFAKFGARNSRNSSAVAVAPSFNTTAARGRSDHLSSGMA